MHLHCGLYLSSVKFGLPCHGFSISSQSGCQLKGKLISTGWTWGKLNLARLFVYFTSFHQPSYVLNTFFVCSGMTRKGSLLNLLQLTYLWVQWILWRNRLWSQQTPFFPFLQLITQLIKSPAMFLMMVLQCWHSKHYQKHLNLLKNGFHFPRNSLLSLERQSGISNKR